LHAHDVTGVGIDPLDRYVSLAEASVAQAGLLDRTSIAKGVMEHIPAASNSFDFIWCRDVLEHVEHLDAGLAEMVRVLRPGTRMLIYTDFATDLLSPQEAAANFEPRGIVSTNMDERNVEAAFARAGLRIDRRDIIGSEWREYAEERSRPVARDLLRLARLRRRGEEIIERFGQDIYNRAKGGLQWSAYQLLGKLQPTMYIVGHA
jgi:SAM-dependent methyltransferase